MKTIDFEYTKAHYYGSHDTINPTLIVPIGPELDLTAPTTVNGSEQACLNPPLWMPGG